MGLRMMGAGETLRILERAMALLGRSQLPRDDDERRAIVLQLSSDAQHELDGLTNEYYQYPDDVHRKLEEFAAANRARFGSA
jgi:hypothetical protein